MPLVTDTSTGVRDRWGAKVLAVLLTAKDGVAKTTMSIPSAQDGSEENRSPWGSSTPGRKGFFPVAANCSLSAAQ